ncbi:MAG: hypothetical protein QM808_18050 [Steroidobacteraceae bacterium]
MSLLRVTVLFTAALLTGCVVTTQVVEHFDEDCQIVTKHVELRTNQSGGGMTPCAETTECIGQLAGIGLISAASVVISGSVVVVGNTVYWLEKQGKCQRQPADKLASAK